MLPHAFPCLLEQTNSLFAIATLNLVLNMTEVAKPSGEYRSKAPREMRAPRTADVFAEPLRQRVR